MNYLTKDYWEKFKPDGKLFEELAKVLIEYEYNDKDFSIVGGPSDGGKDIIKKSIFSTDSPLKYGLNVNSERKLYLRKTSPILF